MTIYEKLVCIQKELKAPKDKNNSFGKYKYRSAESILEAVKPILNTYKCVLLMSDMVEEIGDNNYIKAQAVLVDSEDPGTQIITYAYAREAMDKKGMDASQMTGASSSYARKYALNGLFAIDDSKDADTDEYHNETTAKAKAAPKKITNATTDDVARLTLVSEEQLRGINATLNKKHIEAKKVCEYFGIDSLAKLNQYHIEQIKIILTNGGTFDK